MNEFSHFMESLFSFQALLKHFNLLSRKEMLRKKDLFTGTPYVWVGLCKLPLSIKGIQEREKIEEAVGGNHRMQV